jgi:hypothetical protein
MNKYQKQAILDLVKVSSIILVGFAVVGVIIQMGVTAQELVTVGSGAVMAYCIYQLYLVRVGQLESEDQRKEIEKKYK